MVEMDGEKIMVSSSNFDDGSMIVSVGTTDFNNYGDSDFMEMMITKDGKIDYFTLPVGKDDYQRIYKIKPSHYGRMKTQNETNESAGGDFIRIDGDGKYAESFGAEYRTRANTYTCPEDGCRGCEGCYGEDDTADCACCDYVFEGPTGFAEHATWYCQSCDIRACAGCVGEDDPYCDGCGLVFEHTSGPFDDDGNYIGKAESFGAESFGAEGQPIYERKYRQIVVDDKLKNKLQMLESIIKSLNEAIQGGRFDVVETEALRRAVSEVYSARDILMGGYWEAESFGAEGWHTTRIQNLIDNLYNDREIALNKLLKIKNAKLQNLLSSNKILKNRVGGLSLVEWSQVQDHLKYTPSGRIRTFGAESFGAEPVEWDEWIGEQCQNCKKGPMYEIVEVEEESGEEHYATKCKSCDYQTIWYAETLKAESFGAEMKLPKLTKTQMDFLKYKTSWFMAYSAYARGKLDGHWSPEDWKDGKMEQCFTVTGDGWGNDNIARRTLKSLLEKKVLYTIKTNNSSFGDGRVRKSSAQQVNENPDLIFMQTPPSYTSRKKYIVNEICLGLTPIGVEIIKRDFARQVKDVVGWRIELTLEDGQTAYLSDMPDDISQSIDNHIEEVKWDVEGEQFGAESFGADSEKCPKCDAGNLGKEEMYYCYTCGNDNASEDGCSKCGSDNVGEDEMDYCYNCGEHGHWFIAESFGAETPCAVMVLKDGVLTECGWWNENNEPCVYHPDGKEIKAESFNERCEDPHDKGCRNRDYATRLFGPCHDCLEKMNVGQYDKRFERDGKSFGAELLDYPHPMSDRQKHRIRKLGGRIDKAMSRSDASRYIKSLMATPLHAETHALDCSACQGWGWNEDLNMVCDADGCIGGWVVPKKPSLLERGLELGAGVGMGMASVAIVFGILGGTVGLAAEELKNRKRE